MPQALRQLVHGDGLVLAVAQPGLALIDHALPEGRGGAGVAVVGVHLDPHRQLGAAVEDLAQRREGVVAVRQVQIAVPAHHHRLQVGGVGAESGGAAEGRRLVQARGLQLGDGGEGLGRGGAHVLAVVAEFLADRAVQVIQLLGRVGGPGGAAEVALPAAQLVVDLVVADRGLGRVQFLDADLDDVARLGRQISLVAGVGRRRRILHDGAVVIIVFAAVAGGQHQRQRGQGQDPQGGAPARGERAGKVGVGHAGHE